MASLLANRRFSPMAAAAPWSNSGANDGQQRRQEPDGLPAPQAMLYQPCAALSSSLAAHLAPSLSITSRNAGRCASLAAKACSATTLAAAQDEALAKIHAAGLAA